MAPRRFFTYKKNVPDGRQLRFQEGKGYYAGPAKPAGKRQPPISTNPLMSVISQLQAGLMTPAKMQAQARADVNSQIAAQQLALKKAADDERRQAYAQAQASEGFSKALMGFADHDRAAIERAYGAQAGALSSLGSSLGGQMTGAEDAALAASQGDVNRLAPGGQVPTYVPTGEGAATVGGIAGDAALRLNTESRGYSEGELGSALARGLQGRDLADRYRWQGLQGGKEYMAKLAELQATRPKLYSDTLQGYQGTRNQQLATLLSALSLQTGNVEDQAQANLAKQKFGLSQSEAARDALKDMGMDKFGNPLPGTYRDPRTGRIMDLPGGTVIGPKGLPVKLMTPKGKDAKKATQPKLTDWDKTRTRMMREGANRLGIAEDSKGRVEKGWSLKNIKQYIRRYASDFKATFGDYPQLDTMVDEVANTLFNQLQQRKKAAAGVGKPAAGGAKSF